MQELIRCFKGWFYFWAWNCSIVGGYLLFVPLMLLQIFTTKFHRRILDLLVTYWQYYVTCHVHVTGDPIKSDEISLVISNHRTRVDWNFLWAVMYHAVEGKNRWWYSTKFILKKSIQNIPAAGWVMQMAMYVFINRTWDEDKSVLDNFIEYVDRMDYKHLLILFPEGTDLTPKTIESSNRFAVLNRLPKYEHVLHPRTTGFVYLVDEMRKRNCLDAVYDLTLIYPDDCPQNEEQLFFQGKFPTNVLAHLVRYPVPVLPDNKEGLKLFLEQRWLEKEQTMKEFCKTGNFLYHGSALNRDRYLSKAWAYFTQLIWLGLSCVMIYFLFAHVIYFWLVTVYTLSLYVIPLLKACLRTIGNHIFRKSSKEIKHSVSE